MKDINCTILTVWFYPMFGYCYCHYVQSRKWFIVIDLRLEKIKSSCRKKGITRSSALKDVRCTIVKVIVCILCKTSWWRYTFYITGRILTLLYSIVWYTHSIWNWYEHTYLHEQCPRVLLRSYGKLQILCIWDNIDY